MTVYTAMYHAIYRDTNMSLHLGGCSAIRKEQQEHDSNLEQFEAAGLTEALNHMVDAELQGMGYDHDSVHVHNCVRRSNSRSGSGKESTMTQNIITTLDKVEVGQAIRPVPGSYRSKVTRTEARKGAKPVTISFGAEWADSKFAKVTRTGQAKRVGTYDIGFGNGRTFHAYPGTVKVEIRQTAAQARKAEADAKRHQAKAIKDADAAAQQAQEAKLTATTRRTRKGTVPKGTVAGPGSARSKAAAKAQPAKRGAPVDGDLAAQVKKLRDEEGMAWWKIGQTLNLPGGGPLPAGKRGAGQARKLYRAVNNGELPASARSNGGSRNVATRKPGPAKRKRNALGLAAMSASELREALEGKTITYNYSKPELGTADPVKVEKVKTVKLVGKAEKLAVTFWSDRSKDGFGNERTVYADQIVEVR